MINIIIVCLDYVSIIEGVGLDTASIVVTGASVSERALVGLRISCYVF